MRLVSGVTVCLCIVSGVGGCTADKPSPTGGSAEHDSHDHLHDHGIPDHKPATFAEAVKQLPRRQRLLLSEFSAGHLDHAQEAIQKLQDVIGWLPELAADTDLRESDWNTVQSVSQQMEAVVGHWPSLQSKPPDQEIESLTVLIEQLKTLAEKTGLGQTEWSDSQTNDVSAVSAE